MVLKADITIDIDKQVGNLQNLTNIYNARVGDNNTPLTVLWQKNGMALNLKGLHAFIAGKVGDGSYNSETDKVDFPVGTPVVKYEDDGSGTLDNGQSGLTTLLIPKQMWARTGLFAGYIGLKDENGSVFTSKDIFFKVLGNVLDAGVAINYFIGDFDKALAKAEKELKDKTASFDQTANKALQDLKNKYDQEVAAHEGALIDDESQLRKLANAIDIINSNLEANNVITRPDFEKQNQRIDDTLSKMNLNVESYPELNDVKVKYPTGSSNLIVTNDGYRAVWDGKDWVKGSAFVAASFRNKDVAPTNVSNISYKQVLDNAIDFNSIKRWFQPGPSYVLKQDTSIDLEGTEGDNGLVIKVDASSLNDTFYINFKLKPLRKNNTREFNIYKYKSNDQVGEELFRANSDKYRSNSIKYTKNDFKDYIIDDTFYLLLAVHNEDFFNIKISVSNNRISTNLQDVADKVTCPDELSTTSLSAENWNTWNASDDSYMLINNSEGLYFKQVAAGDVGIYLQQNVNSTKDLYVTITTLNSNGFSCFLLKDFSQIPMPEAELTYQYSSTVSNDRYTTYVFHMSSSVAKKLEIDKEIILLLVTHSQDSFVQIKDISISNAPGSRFIAKKIDQLYSASGMNFSTQVGNVGLLKEVEDSAGVHYIAPKFVCDKDNQVINQINVFAKNKGTLNFTVGTIDQNQLLVNTKNYQFDVKTAGLQNLSTNIPINSGETLLLDISNGMADLYQPTEINDEAYIQDDAHLSQNKGYSGKILYLAKYALPYEFYYQRKNLNDLLKNNSDQIEALKAENEDLKGQIKKKNIFKGNDNQFYKLQVINGKLSVDNIIPNNVVIIGNSLTSNTGLIGMNASDANHDYYHYVTEYIKSKNPDVKINPRTNVSPWEQTDDNPPTAEREKVFNDTIKPLLSADTNLVIIQLGDNVNNDVRMSTLLNDAKELLQEIKSVSPKAEIYWVYGWFGGYDQVQMPIQNACNAEGATGIDIADLNTKDNQGTMGSTFTGLDGKTYTVTDPGVAEHPGDKGHKAIADRIINNFDF